LFIFLLTYAKQQFGLGQTDRKADEMVNRKKNSWKGGEKDR
jgi:hypothetical protein